MTYTIEDQANGHRVTVCNVNKNFGAIRAVDGVSFDIDPGTFLVLLGPSGSGKTTLLRGLAGIEKFDAGVVTFADTVVSDGNTYIPPEKRGLSMVFQDYALWPHFTVAENVAYALKRERIDKAAMRRRTREALERVGIAEKGDAYPQELSGGQQQRVALARAIVARPPVLLFDEPLSNLDAHLREQMRVEISTITRETGCTAIYITHDQKEAFALADVIGVLESGHLEQFGTPQEIYANPASSLIARFTGIAGTFAGVVSDKVDDSRCVVKVGERWMAARWSAPLPLGANAEMVIRPSAVRMVRPDDAEWNEQETLIPAHVTDVAYRGHGYEHAVHCEYGDLSGVFDVTGWLRGDPCYLAIDPADCFVFATGGFSQESTDLTRKVLELV